MIRTTVSSMARRGWIFACLFLLFGCNSLPDNAVVRQYQLEYGDSPTVVRQVIGDPDLIAYYWGDDHAYASTLHEFGAFVTRDMTFVFLERGAECWFRDERLSHVSMLSVECVSRLRSIAARRTPGMQPTFILGGPSRRLDLEEAIRDLELKESKEFD